MNKFMEKMTNMAGRAEIQLKKNSPEILLAVGIVSFVGTVVLACHATLKADDKIQVRKKKIAEIHQAKEAAESGAVNDQNEITEYDENLYKQDLMQQYGKMSLEVVTAYAPAIALGALSLTCILTSRNILHRRYLGAVSAYNAVSEAFRTYRKRVLEEQGELMDRHYRYGTEIETISKQEVDENGKKKTVKEKVENLDPGKFNPSEQAVFFDSTNPNWDKNPAFNKMFLNAQQNILTDRLRARGCLFLNEVYDALGFPPTTEGALLGWVVGMGDDYVDFGMYDSKNDSARRFVNGDENVILLDFNHDGIIYDKI